MQPVLSDCMLNHLCIFQISPEVPETDLQYPGRCVNLSAIELPSIRRYSGKTTTFTRLEVNPTYMQAYTPEIPPDRGPAEDMLQQDTVRFIWTVSF